MSEEPERREGRSEPDFSPETADPAPIDRAASLPDVDEVLEGFSEEKVRATIYAWAGEDPPVARILRQYYVEGRPLAEIEPAGPDEPAAEVIRVFEWDFAAAHFFPEDREHLCAPGDGDTDDARLSMIGWYLRGLGRENPDLFPPMEGGHERDANLA
jgi:hypothetical protein